LLLSRFPLGLHADEEVSISYPAVRIICPPTDTTPIELKSPRDDLPSGLPCPFFAFSTPRLCPSVTGSLAKLRAWQRNNIDPVPLTRATEQSCSFRLDFLTSFHALKQRRARSDNLLEPGSISAATPSWHLHVQGLPRELHHGVSPSRSSGRRVIV
jgi:hypothetical protein